MVRCIGLILLLGGSLAALGQSDTKNTSLNTQNELFSGAVSNYNFNDPNLKPWHLKVSYELYDERGNPSQQGIYEYWWASPNVHRSSWNRTNAVETDWKTADGKDSHELSGERLRFSEYKLRSAILNPLPNLSNLDPARFHLEQQVMNAGKGVKLPCIVVTPNMHAPKGSAKAALGLFPTYCFDSAQPLLLVSFSMEAITTQFTNIVQMQNHYIPRNIVLTEGGRKILSATVDSIDTLAGSEPVFAPSPGATPGRIERVHVDPTERGSLLNKTEPEYPADARAAHISGVVVVDGVVAFDGSVHDLKAVSTPMPSLAFSALKCVSQWRYRPFQKDGKPVEAEIEIHMMFLPSK